MPKATDTPPVTHNISKPPKTSNENNSTNNKRSIEDVVHKGSVEAVEAARRKNSNNKKKIVYYDVDVDKEITKSTQKENLEYNKRSNNLKKRSNTDQFDRVPTS